MPRPHLGLLGDEDIEFLHDRVLAVLETVGARFESPKARAVMDQAGCVVDEESHVVSIPRSLVEKSIASLRRDVLLAGRDPQMDILLDGSRTYQTTAGICPYIVDRQTGQPREPGLADLAEIGRIGDALDEVALMWFAVSPSADAPSELSDLASLACLLASTGKHIMGQLVRPRDVPVAVEMLRLAAPGNDLRARPIFSSIYCPVAPLTHEGEAMEAGMEMAKAGIPLDIFSLALAGATSPMTLAGTVVQTMADELSAAVLFKLVAPDCSLILSANSGIMDMSTSRFATSTPETLLMSVAEIELVRSYGAPSLSVGHVSDSYEMGFRGGLEDMAQAMMTRLAGPDVMIGLGTVEAGQAMSLTKLVLDAEVAQHGARIERGLDLDEDHAAVEAITSVGPGGNYLGRKETRRHLRSGEHWMPRLLQRRSFQDWAKLTHSAGVDANSTPSAGSEQAELPNEFSGAEARVAEILATRQPLPLPDGVSERLAEMVRGVSCS